MSDALKTEPYQIIWLIRRLFRALTQKSNENLEGFGISAADRAILEFLYPDEKLSVPEIAQKYNVSRQHIQVTVNSLLDAGLVITRENPRHKRSRLIALNSKGRKLFGRVLEKDEQVINDLFFLLSKEDIQITRQTLQSLLNEVSSGASK